MKIIPLIGIDCIRFGISMTEVRSLWGQPKSINYFIPLKERPEDRSVNWEYTTRTELSFDSDDEFVLGSITMRSNKALLNGLSLIGKSIKELKPHFPYLLLEDDFEENGQNYVLQELEVSFWVIDGLVDSITIYQEYDSSGNNPIYPQSSS